jgi:hypothetical protein
MSTIVTRQTTGAGATTNKGSPLTNAELDANFMNLNVDKIEVSSKDSTGGVPGLTAFKINMRNVANTFTSWLTNSNTASRTYTLKDADGTVAFTSDITDGSLAVVIVSGTTQTAVAGNHYVLTNVAATTVTLPASPASGDTVAITPDNSLTTNVIARNGQTIMKLSEDMTLDNSSATVTLRFLNNSWRLI